MSEEERTKKNVQLFLKNYSQWDMETRKALVKMLGKNAITAAQYTFIMNHLTGQEQPVENLEDTVRDVFGDWLKD